MVHIFSSSPREQTLYHLRCNDGSNIPPVQLDSKTNLEVRSTKCIFLICKDKGIKYNAEKSTDGKTVKGENSTLAFKYTDISEGKVCLSVLTSSFHWTSSVCTQNPTFMMHFPTTLSCFGSTSWRRKRQNLNTISLPLARYSSSNIE